MSSASGGYNQPGATTQEQIKHQDHALPFTGFDAGPLLGLGVLFVAVGMALRKVVSA